MFRPTAKNFQRYAQRRRDFCRPEIGGGHGSRLKNLLKVVCVFFRPILFLNFVSNFTQNIRVLFSALTQKFVPIWGFLGSPHKFLLHKNQLVYICAKTIPNILDVLQIVMEVGEAYKSATQIQYGLILVFPY